MTKKEIWQYFKERGHRMSRGRQLIVETLSLSRQPLSAMEILSCLKKRCLTVHKTTIYRELDFLEDKGLIKEIEFGDGCKRYEIISDTHHHHLYCVECKNIDKVLLENDLIREEKKISRVKNFKILRHSLEFFGLCANCRVSREV